MRSSAVATLTRWDKQILRKARRAANGEHFKALYDMGDATGYPSESEADLAIAAMCLFWTNGDLEWAERLMLHSKLLRSKWFEPRDDQTYLQLTLQTASASFEEGYEDADTLHYFGEKGRIIAPYVAKDIMAAHRFMTFGDMREIAVYNAEEGTFSMDGEAIVRERVQELLKHKTTKNAKNEVIDYIRDATRVERGIIETPLHLIPASNGLFNIQTGDLENFSPDVPVFVKHPVEYRPDLLQNPPGKAKRVIETIFGTSDLTTVQEIAGATLYRAPLYKKAIMLLGEGDNGKSLFLNLLTAMLGSTLVTNKSLFQLTNNRFASADLYHKNANIFADLGGGDLAHVGTFMVLTGGDRISAERKHQHPFEYVNYAVLLFSTNVLPNVKKPPEQFYKRWILVDMPFRFIDGPDPSKRNEKQRDEKLYYDITSDPDEMSWLFTWAIEGLQRLLKQQQFTESPSAKDIKQRWISKTDSLQAFVEAKVDESVGHYVDKRVFNSIYRKWCDENHMHPFSISYIGRHLPDYISTRGYGNPAKWADIAVVGVPPEAMEESHREGQLSLVDEETEIE